MGLYIYSKSELEYQASYSGLHYIRYMAYLSQEGEKSYSEWHSMNRRDIEPDWAYSYCLLLYPNLYWHSDCGGTYTLRGKLDFTKGKLETGNSKQLLWELDDIKDRLAGGVHESVPEHHWPIFDMLHELVKDTVENHGGKLTLA